MLQRNFLLAFLIASACFADLLKQAGIEVDYRNYDGVAHEFFSMGAVVDEAKQAEEQAAEGLKP
jgi:acetyl esterase